MIAKLEPMLEATGKKGPDLIVCTHYDADHIGGLKKIVTNYGTGINLIWMHTPGINEQLNETFRLLNESREGKVLNFKEYIQTGMLATNLNEDKLDIVIESYKQMNKLVELIKATGITLEEPFSGTRPIGWPEVVVLGPTPDFYQSCYDKINTPARLLEAEVLEIEQHVKYRELKPMLERAVRQSCDYLDQQRKDHVTEVNQVSVILMITAAKKRYLFTGDASLESFENLPDYPKCIKNIHWLKVPHHGSHNNSSPELFGHMSPEVAFISGGDRYLDYEVMHCLEDKKCIVKTTRDHGDLHYPLDEQ